MIKYPHYSLPKNMRRMLDDIHGYNTVAVNVTRFAGLTDSLLHYILNFGYNFNQSGSVYYYVAGSASIVKDVSDRMKNVNSNDMIVFTTLSHLNNSLLGRSNINAIVFDGVDITAREVHSIKTSATRATNHYQLIFANCQGKDFPKFSDIGIVNFDYN